MTLSAPHRPLAAAALLAGATVVLAGCGVNERDPHRFESLADTVAAIPVSSPDAASSAAPAKRAPLKVELLTPHELWDARDGLTGHVRVAAAPPAKVRDPEAPAALPAPQTPVGLAAPVEAGAPVATRPIQLGAFASEASARGAWERMRGGEGGVVLNGLQPAFEPVEVGGRRLVRLKVMAASDRVEALCRSLAASDPWCARAAAGPSTGAI